MSSWSLVKKRGQDGIGYVEIYKSVVKGHKTLAIISYLPQFTNSSKERNVNIVLMFEGQDSDITKGLFYGMYDELGEIVKSKEDDYFKRNKEKLEVVITQTLVIDKMPSVNLLSHGDFSIE